MSKDTQQQQVGNVPQQVSATLPDREPMWTKADKQVIQTQFFPTGTTEAEMKYCLNVAESLGLNPILKQIWFVPRRQKVNNQWVDKIEPMAGRDSFLTLAHRSGHFAGIKSWCEIKEGPKLVGNEWQTVKDLYGIAEVYRDDTDHVYRIEVAYSEYVQLKQDKTPTVFWKEKPQTMIKKVAESQCLRKAFNITGLHDEIEIPESELKSVNATVIEDRVANTELIDVAQDQPASDPKPTEEKKPAAVSDPAPDETGGDDAPY